MSPLTLISTDKVAIVDRSKEGLREEIPTLTKHFLIPLALLSRSPFLRFTPAFFCLSKLANTRLHTTLFSCSRNVSLHSHASLNYARKVDWSKLTYFRISCFDHQKWHCSFVFTIQFQWSSVILPNLMYSFLRMDNPHRVVIIGSGPTAVGAALRLNELIEQGTIYAEVR